MSAFVGNESSGVVHAYWCDAVFAMSPHNFVSFDSLHDAITLEYEECDYCMGAGWHRAWELAAVRERTRAEGFRACLVCAETRGIQRAHIIPRRYRGVELMPLCPRCHWNYDHGEMTAAEFEKVRRWAWENKRIRITKEPLK